MIISDDYDYKLDVTWTDKSNAANESNLWLKLTTFNAKSDAEWEIKSISISSESIKDLYNFLHKNLNSLF